MKTCKDILDFLVVNYEGNKDVQFRKDVTFTSQYESFIIKDDEREDDMFKRMLVLLPALETLG